jgi:hypothetical protein
MIKIPSFLLTSCFLKVKLQLYNKLIHSVLTECTNMKTQTAKELMKTGNNLVERAREYSFTKHQRGDIYKIHDLVACDYGDWKNDVIKFLKRSGANEQVVYAINCLDTLFVNTVDWAKEAIDPAKKTKAIRLYIQNVGRIIKVLSTLKKRRNKIVKKINVDDVTLSYDEKTSSIIFDNFKIEIPTNSIEQEFCKKLFKMEIGSFIGWDLFYNDMDEEKDTPDKKAKTQLEDTLRRINKRLLKYFKKGSRLAKFEKKNIKRLH